MTGSRTAGAVWLAMGAIALLAAPTIAAVGIRSDLEALRQLVAAARTQPDGPDGVPRLFRGRLRGPATRLTPLGTRASVHWWRVIERSSRSTYTRCRGSDGQNVQLITPMRTYDVAFLADRERPALVSDAYAWDWSGRVVIDLGSWRETESSRVPDGVGPCAAPFRRYVEQLVPHDWPVEIVACASGNRLEACRAALGATLTVTSIPDHVARRAREARFGVRLAGLVACVLAVIMGLALVMYRGNVFRVIAGSGRARS